MFLKCGMLKISPKCKGLIHELENLQWGEKEGDDCTDALRYLLVRIYDLYPQFRDFSSVVEKAVISKSEQTAMAKRMVYNANNLVRKDTNFEIPDWIRAEVS